MVSDLLHVRYFLTLIIILNSGCSLIRKEGTWGKNALWPLESERVRWAFKKNISSAHVWLPLTGAAVIRWGGYDNKVAHEIAEEHHIFIDHKHADHWSDFSNEVLKYQVYASTLLTPSMGNDSDWTEWTRNKIKGGAVVISSSSIARYTRDRAAEAFPRERPNRADRYSFPSSHSTKAGAYNILVHKNIDQINMDDRLRFSLKVVSTTMAATTAWARVEGHRHYPSDVLAGYALGSFVSGFIYDVFMNDDNDHAFALVPSGDKWTAQYVIHF